MLSGSAAVEDQLAAIPRGADGPALAAVELQAISRIVVDSPPDRTIARCVRLTADPAKGHIHAGFLGRDKVGRTITRAEVAAFRLVQLTDTRFPRAAPATSN